MGWHWHIPRLFCTSRAAGSKLPPTPPGRGQLAGGTNLRATLLSIFPQAKKSRNSLGPQKPVSFIASLIVSSL